jgi:exosortase/archaeosortase family protein
MGQKKVFKTIFIFASIILMVLPFMLLFNDVLTKLFEKFVLYNLLQEKIIPFQAKLIGLLIKPLGINYVAYKDGMLVNNFPIKITWNCLGWQSLVLFFLSTLVGLSGSSYKFLSLAKTIVLGLLGLFWINVFRITFTVTLVTYSMPIFRVVFHDYLAAIVTIFYLLGYWWFSYSFVLEEKSRVLN